jgi:hypothetical protein
LRVVAPVDGKKQVDAAVEIGIDTDDENAAEVRAARGVIDAHAKQHVVVAARARRATVVERDVERSVRRIADQIRIGGACLTVALRIEVSADHHRYPAGVSGQTDRRQRRLVALEHAGIAERARADQAGAAFQNPVTAEGGSAGVVGRCRNVRRRVLSNNTDKRFTRASRGDVATV